MIRKPTASLSSAVGASAAEQPKEYTTSTTTTSSTSFSSLQPTPRHSFLYPPPAARRSRFGHASICSSIKRPSTSVSSIKRPTVSRQLRRTDDSTVYQSDETIFNDSMRFSIATPRVSLSTRKAMPRTLASMSRRPPATDICSSAIRPPSVRRVSDVIQVSKLSFHKQKQSTAVRSSAALRRTAVGSSTLSRKLEFVDDETDGGSWDAQSSVHSEHSAASENRRKRDIRKLVKHSSKLVSESARRFAHKELRDSETKRSLKQQKLANAESLLQIEDLSDERDVLKSTLRKIEALVKSSQIPDSLTSQILEVVSV